MPGTVLCVVYTFVVQSRQQLTKSGCADLKALGGPQACPDHMAESRARVSPSLCRQGLRTRKSWFPMGSREHSAWDRGCATVAATLGLSFPLGKDEIGLDVLQTITSYTCLRFDISVISEPASFGKHCCHKKNLPSIKMFSILRQRE